MDKPITFDSKNVTVLNVNWNPVLEMRHSIECNEDFYSWPVNNPIPTMINVNYEPVTDEVKADAVPADIGTGSGGSDPIQ